MVKLRLKDWAAKNGLSYLTANRYFHANMIPGAVQLDSGTILVEDNTMETTVNNSNDAAALFLKKTVEFSKNNATVEDFAAYVISNFQLRLNNGPETPKYSKLKPKPEEVQKHFRQFIPNKETEEHLKSVKTLVKNLVKSDPHQETPSFDGVLSDTLVDNRCVSSNDLIQNDTYFTSNHIVGSRTLTPQNYTNSTSSAPNNNSSSFTKMVNTPEAVSSNYFISPDTVFVGETSEIKDNLVNDNHVVRRKRGRKPLKSKE